MAWPAFTWTWTGNYPAGPNPWNGQPLAVDPGVTYVVPKTKIPAEVFNYCIGALATECAELFTNVQNLSAGGTVSRGVVEMTAGAAAGGGSWSSTSSYDQVTGASPGPVQQGTLVNVLAGDIIEMVCAVTLTGQNASARTGAVRLEYIENYGGSGTTSAITQSEQVVTIPGTGLVTLECATIQALHTVVTPGPFAFFLNGFVSVATSGFGIQQGNVIQRVWRPVST